ncbi:MAG: hypothetical protein EBR01_07380 [Proteobacteria bacterium]|nr:hypothetical protein [Pseudomonadota bacterium]
MSNDGLKILPQNRGNYPFFPSFDVDSFPACLRILYRLKIGVDPPWQPALSLDLKTYQKDIYGHWSIYRK